MVVGVTQGLEADRRDSKGQAARRTQLIEATISSIARNGLAGTTLAKVTSIAGLTPGIVSFYFKSKDALLLASVRHLTEEFEFAWRNAVDLPGAPAEDRLRALIAVCFTSRLSHPDRVSVWYAFWGEVRARDDYLRLCGDRDAAFLAEVRDLIEALVADAGQPQHDAGALAQALVGLIDSLWQNILTVDGDYDRAGAERTCLAFLGSIFPDRFAASGPLEGRKPANGHDATTDTAPSPLSPTLPAWTYDNAEFHALEREHLFSPNWQFVCHSNDLPKPGDYVAMELIGERVFVIRGMDNALRAFHNVCRHRAHAVVMGEQGTCKSAIRCPYHGWTYDFDGRLKAVPAEKTFPGLEKDRHGLKGLDLEVFLGFVYVRLAGEGPSVAERMASVSEELLPYRFEDLQPYREPYEEDIPVDWKNVWDNYLEGYHFVTGHPGLTDLTGQAYEVTPLPQGVARLSHGIKDKPCKTWSARHYQKLLPPQPHLSQSLQRRWSYFAMFPGHSFDVYPETMDVFQVLPVAPGRCKLRGRYYTLPATEGADPRSREARSLRAARYLNARMNWQVFGEDNNLIESVQGGLASRSYDVGVLSQKEAVVRHFQDWIRERLPVATLRRVPDTGSLATRNAAMVP